MNNASLNKSVKALPNTIIYMGWTWTTPAYSKSQVDKAGEILGEPLIDDSENSGYDNLNDHLEALNILNNWRSAHSFPLNIFQTTLRRYAKKIETEPLVVQRLKRTPSILKKLERKQTHTMKLSQMQDIGGCRAVLKTDDNARKLEGLYKKSNIKHKLVNTKDYILKPKPDGYRSIHLIYKYNSDKMKTFNGLLIEIQLRSRIQHAWATAVETVDLFTKQAIKSNEGREDWSYFFKIVSSAFAALENCPPVPGTPIVEWELHKQVEAFAKDLKVIQKMKGWTYALKTFPLSSPAYFFLLQLDVSTEELKITSYDKFEESIATNDYAKAETEYKNNPQKDVVLVGADSIEDLKKAYPNYFADTEAFINYLEAYLKKYNPK